MKKIYVCALLSLILFIPHRTHAYSVDYVKDYVIARAVANRVPVTLALYVLEHESNFCKDRLGDMDIYRKGRPVRARGCFQITEFYHPDISDDQAFDLEWSTEWAMQYMQDPVVCKRMWTTCRDFYNSQIYYYWHLASL